MAKGDKKEKSETISFEQAIEQLNSIVSQIETGQVPLQESLEQYEKGMNLIRYCRGILQSAEKRIEQISAAGDAESTKPDRLSSKEDSEEQELF